MAKRINIFTTKLIKEKGGLYELDHKVIRSPDDAANIINKVLDMESLPNEHFVIATLSTKNEVVGIHQLFKGSLNASIVHPREVFQAALLNNAASIVAFHNHPSGDPSPSKEDIEVTKRLVEAGKIIGIDVLDHLIIGEGRYISLKEKGYC